MNFVRAINGHEVALSAVVEVVPAEQSWLVTLRLHDGTTRLVIAEKWQRAKTLAARQIVVATSEAYLLTLEEEGATLVAQKHPIVAWVLEDGHRVIPMTSQWIYGGDAAILHADGSVDDDIEHFNSLHEWLESEKKLRRG